MTVARADAEKAADGPAKMKVLQAALEKIKTDVLTDEQRKQLEELKAKGAQFRERMRQRMQERRSERPAAGSAQ